ncbi:16S rRNA (guanine(966)-N(2))-methyltransferase RsmD [Patescibacteria group bacterium]|nr:16S rRNA (guanine(966)-N(2))-methyltransferase RsmD [Patescibacteria group bacterium]MBU1952807.1 16S rRNA (guanine(966)-N(2))-methyltransferase RsmD [Patescibacteria group bacterium]
MKNQNFDQEKQKEIRIITGSAKNKKLKAPDIEGFRAVQEITKASLFSMLGEKITDAVCLDLFAGSGNLGLEALSRGALWCDFVDESPESIKVIEENIVMCGFLEKSSVIRKDAGKYVVNTDRNYDVILLDPWYKDTSHRHLVSNLGNILKENGIIALFHGDELRMAPLIQGTPLVIADERKFGKSTITLLEKA